MGSILISQRRETRSSFEQEAIMNNPFPSNSSSMYKPLIGNLGYRILSSVEMQSSSITSKGSLWQETLLHIAYKNPPSVPPRKISNRDESNQSVELPAKNQAAIELLRSWREDDEYDEEEQKATWEFLK